MSAANGVHVPDTFQRGAQPGNANALRHGVHTWQAAGKVPLKIKGGQHLRCVLRRLRRELLDEVERVQGRQPTLYEAAIVSTVVRHEGRAKLLEKWLAEEFEKLSVQDRVTILKAIGDASDSRDKCLRMIGLEKACQPVDAWAAIYSAPANGTPQRPAAASADSEPGQSAQRAAANDLDAAAAIPANGPGDVVT